MGYGYVWDVDIHTTSETNAPDKIKSCFHFRFVIYCLNIHVN